MKHGTMRAGISGKVIAGETADTHEYAAYIVSDDHAPALQDVAKWLRRFNRRNVVITVEVIDDEN